jgi:hypothetical protein
VVNNIKNDKLKVGQVFYQNYFENPYDSIIDSLFIKDVCRGYALCSIVRHCLSEKDTSFFEMSKKQIYILEYYNEVLDVK